MKKSFLIIVFLSLFSLLFTSCDQSVVPTQTLTEETDNLTDTPVSETIKTKTDTHDDFIKSNLDFWNQILISPQKGDFSSGAYFNANKLESAELFGTGFDVWPIQDNGTWCHCAFIELPYIVKSNIFNPSENICNGNSEYTFGLYYHPTDKTVTSTDDLIGPYTLMPFRHYQYENGNNIYFLSVVDCPEGSFINDFKVGQPYSALVYVAKNEQVISFGYFSFTWSENHERYKELFNRFWATRDRSKGYTTGMHTLTDKDIKDQNELGFLAKG
ncbi:MAG: hypothetical protein E7675_06220 [Ruminococcaceae bacterium]|nr:hypothetical protein [Oscillospiraceae bacterium]